ncbi:helicase C-terminal domain-containing protein [Saccharolobus caldissimus]|uniref:DEAD/DEAH box helicase n=1 Tax=Saccharolobus caldissimus TaxID=1702097 RepID=A0AAQ4CN26_9CREN|nr:ATP-dependent DNA helicase [Saccharolobus caldissimus]BDB97207.1 DEAD/DEAH box helicase [Saccharolobus caldissimus]
MKLREWQQQIADIVVKLLKDNFLVALQAPTGSGKTLFALYTSFKVKDKVIFVVRTHNEFFPIYRELATYFKDKKYSFLVGKSSACVYSNGDVDSQDIYCGGCDLFNGVNIEIRDPPVSALNRLKKEGKSLGYCPYYSLLESIRNSHVILLTYPYLFIPWLRETLDINWEEYVIVVDEAHNIENISNLEERRLSKRTLELAISQAKSKEAIDIMEKIKNKIGKISSSDEKYILINNITEISPSEEEMEILLHEYEEIRKEMIRNKNISRNYIGSIIRFFEILNDERVKIFSYSNSLVAKYIISSDFINILNDERLTFMLMSGTMQPLDYLRDVIGIKRKLVYIDVEKITKNKISGSYECLISIDVTSAYSLRSERMAARYASYLLKIFYNSKSHILAIFPSYEFMRFISKFLNIKYLMENSDTDIEEVMEKAKKEEKLLIMGIARGKLSEGIEIVNNGSSMISDVVIVGVPYPPIDDYLKIRVEEISKRIKKDLSDDLIRIQALIAVKQSIGRAIRGPNDKATVWLLDKRFDSLWWKKELNCLNARKIKL